MARSCDESRNDIEEVSMNDYLPQAAAGIAALALALPA
jgi:hypothetical protein